MKDDTGSPLYACLSPASQDISLSCPYIPRQDFSTSLVSDDRGSCDGVWKLCCRRAIALQPWPCSSGSLPQSSTDFIASPRSVSPIMVRPVSIQVKQTKRTPPRAASGSKKNGKVVFNSSRLSSGTKEKRQITLPYKMVSQPSPAVNQSSPVRPGVSYAAAAGTTADAAPAVSAKESVMDISPSRGTTASGNGASKPMAASTRYRQHARAGALDVNSTEREAAITNRYKSWSPSSASGKPTTARAPAVPAASRSLSRAGAEIAGSVIHGAAASIENTASSPSSGTNSVGAAVSASGAALTASARPAAVTTGQDITSPSRLHASNGASGTLADKVQGMEILVG